VFLGNFLFVFAIKERQKMLFKHGKSLIDVAFIMKKNFQPSKIQLFDVLNFLVRLKLMKGPCWPIDAFFIRANKI